MVTKISDTENSINESRKEILEKLKLMSNEEVWELLNKIKSENK